MLAFSSLLTTKNSYRTFWQQLKKILNENKIKYQLLENNKDVWCRDYMPVKVNNNDYLQFNFNPNYLLGLDHLKTNPTNVLPYPKNVMQSSLKVDGGSIIKGKNLVFYSSIIPQENEITSEEVQGILCENLKVEKAIEVQKYPYDFTGHLDALVRFIDNERIFFANVHPSDSYRKKFLRQLESSGMELFPFPYFDTERRNKYGYYTAIGCYLNYLRLDNHILMPQFCHKLDAEAVKAGQQYFSDFEIIPVLCNEVAEYSGALNCISWN